MHLCASYKVRAAIFHEHVECASVNMPRGHFVTAVWQHGRWHMANDEVVRNVKITDCPLVPCCILKGVMTGALGKPCWLKAWWAKNILGKNAVTKKRLR